MGLTKDILDALHRHSAAIYEACEPSLSPWPQDPDGSTLRFSATIAEVVKLHSPYLPNDGGTARCLGCDQDRWDDRPCTTLQAIGMSLELWGSPVAPSMLDTPYRLPKVSKS